MLAMFEEPRVIRALINVGPDVDLHDFDTQGSLASKMAGTPFFVPPAPDMVEPSQIFNTLVKHGIRGIQWQSGTVFSPQDNLKFVGTIARRMQYLLLPRPQLKVAAIQALFPGFEFEAGVNSNLFEQLKAFSLRPGTDVTGWFAASSLANKSADIISKASSVYADVLGLPSTSPIVIDFTEIITNKQSGSTDFMFITGGVSSPEPDLLTEVVNLSVQMRTQATDTVAIVGNRFPNFGQLIRETRQAKAKRSNRPGLSERSAIAPETRIAIDAVANRQGYEALALRLDSWFRGFLNQNVQGAVAGLFLARLDAFLSAPLEVTRGERLAFLGAGDGYDEDPEAIDDQGAEENLPEEPAPDETSGVEVPADA